MEYKQNEYSFSRCSSAFFLGIVFVLVPVSLSADLVYDKEVFNISNSIFLFLFDKLIMLNVYTYLIEIICTLKPALYLVFFN